MASTANFAITIESPSCGDSSVWATPVSGRVFASKHDPVQIMVLAADGMWYPQPRVVRHGHHYQGLAYLGWEKNPNSPTYTIAAGVGGCYITEVVKELPMDVLWTKVKVGRI